MKGLRLTMKRLAGDEQGTSLIELALFLPLMITLLVGMVDFTQAFALRLNLQRAANSALELAVAVRPSQAKNSSEIDFSFLAAEAARAAGVPPQDVTVTTWLECDGVEQSDFEGECDDGEPVARYVQVTVEAIYDPMFTISMSRSRTPLLAEAAIRIQ